MWATKTSTKSPMSKLFEKFCESSTVHGTYFWHESSTALGKFAWVIVVLTGICSSIWIIDNSFKAWSQAPVITAVEQIPIEKTPFPSITICPLEKTVFGHVENALNAKGAEAISKFISFRDVFFDVLSILRQGTEPDECLKSYCSSLKEEDGSSLKNSAPCQSILQDFKAFEAEREIYNFKSEMIKWLDRLLLLPPQTANDGSNLDPEPAFEEEQVDCLQKSKDFRLWQNWPRLFPQPLDLQKAISKPGSLLRWLFVQSKDALERRKLFDKYLSAFSDFYVSIPRVGGVGNQTIRVPDLIDVLTGSDSDFEDDFDVSGLVLNDELLRIMQSSIQSPHLVDHGNKSDAYQAGAAFLFCHYDKENEKNSGMKYGPYMQRYCNAFQTTMNEIGLCYTINNYDLGTAGLSEERDQDFFKVRNVEGCGKRKGLRLVIDSQRLAFRSKANYLGGQRHAGYQVFVTNPGVVTQKVLFNVDPSFYGEYDIHIHGLHFIDASPQFIDWNKETKVCYFPKDKNLTTFTKHYSQDNCVMECKLLKIAKRCGCFPWYEYQENGHNSKMCDSRGNACFKAELDLYAEDLIDRQECDCRSDCGGLHMFYSATRHSFEDRSVTDIDQYFSPQDQVGSSLLEDYLIDPNHAFVDEITSNLTQLLYGKNKTELAWQRMDNDILVLNFYYDTPIITRIQLEMRVNVFDQISAIGGTLGLFTGVSLITFVEIIYWMVRFAVAFFFGYEENSAVGEFFQQTLKVAELPAVNEKGKNNSFNNPRF